MNTFDFVGRTARRWVGAFLFGGTVIFVGGSTYLNQHALQASYAVPFNRGNNPGDGADGVEAEAAQMLSAYPKLHAKVVGYTEAGGDAGADVVLSSQRAQTVRDALVDAGVPAERIAAYGQGSANPLPRKSEESDAEYSRRLARVEITLER